MHAHAPDPSTAAPYPRGLALDLALKTAPLVNILASYGITNAQAKAIFANEAFRVEYEGHRDSMQNEGYTFQKKAAAQAEAYLELLWRLAHADGTPASVKADIVKSTVKWGGLEAIPVQTALPSAQELVNHLQKMPDHELEVQVMRIISKKQTKGVANEREALVHDDWRGQVGFDDAARNGYGAETAVVFADQDQLRRHVHPGSGGKVLPVHVAVAAPADDD